MNILNTPIFELNENINQLPIQVLDNHCIVTKCFRQYAAGITGCEHSIHAYVKDQFGFETKREAYKAAAASNLLPYSKSGKDTPYGEIGSEQRTREIYTIREIIEGSVTYCGLSIYKFELLD